MRSYIRHPSDIPIQIDLTTEKNMQGKAASEAVSAETSDQTQGQQLSNISHGGLAFNAERPLETGAVITLKISSVQPAFEAEGLVTHCSREGQHYVIGIEFISKDSLFVARMVEQVCHIEHYKRAIAEKEGRHLSGEEAAKEWIERYAASFPQWATN